MYFLGSMLMYKSHVIENCPQNVFLPPFVKSMNFLLASGWPL